MDLICRLKENKWVLFYLVTVIINTLIYIIISLLPDLYNSLAVKIVSYTSSSIVFIVSMYMILFYKNSKCEMQSFYEKQQAYKEIVNSVNN
jgi:hypothetical protein